MRYLLTTTFAAVIGLLMVQPAQAESPAGNSFYGSAFVGPVFSTNNTGIGPDGARYHIEVEHDAGYHIGGAVGGWIGPNYRSEIAVGWRAYDVDSRVRPNGSATGDGFVSQDDAEVAYLLAGGLDARVAGLVADPAIGVVNPIDEVTAIDVVWNNYFHVLEGAHQPYAGFGIGVSFWSVDGDATSDAFKTSVLLNAMLGYDFYLSGLPGNFRSQIDSMMGSSSSILDDIAVGVEYRFSWANPKLSSIGGNRSFLGNGPFQQTSHEILFNARYEF